MVTPVLIPNTAVKHCSGDDTLMGKVASRQNQAFKKRKNSQNNCGFFLLHLMLIYTHMSWGTQRRNRILLIIFIVVAVPAALWFFVFSYKAPTCFDGKKNGSEIGVDCGGNCSLLCQSQALAPYVKWERFFPVAPGIFNAVAYVENQNSNASTVLKYKFTLFDSENAILAEKVGTARLLARENIPIVSGQLSTGKATPTRISFEITNKLVWNNQPPRELKILVEDEKLTEEEKQTSVIAKLSNIGLERILDISAFVILYDRNDNSVGVSSTYVDKINPNESKNIVFTWPRNFGGEVVRFEIIPLYEGN